ncbi:MAG TPA: hypothetical protein VL651_12425 [Bacteroidia bacterium]|nr:hypothetical protein [Bacteroidia bacterium]
MRKLIVFCFFILSVSLFAGDTLCPVVAFFPLKNKQAQNYNDTTRDLTVYSKKGFLLVVNGMYDLQFKDGRRIPDARIVSLSLEKQTMNVTTAFSPITAFKNHIIYDTITYAVTDIEKLRLIGDRAYGIFDFVKTSDYSVRVVSSGMYCEMQEVRVRSYNDSSIIYNGFFYLSSQGWDYIYEMDGALYFSNGLDFIYETLIARKEDQ